MITSYYAIISASPQPTGILLIDSTRILSFVFYLIILVISISIHEFSHAITADRLGDSTPRNQGRLTLNPLAHLDRFGSLMILLSSLAGFGIGWGKPVRVNPYAFRITPRAGMGVVALAGPVSNLILATLGAIVLRALGAGSTDFLTLFFLLWVQTNVALALFNLIPVFPLDGYNVFLAILEALKQDWSYKLAFFWQKQVQYGPMLLLLLLVVDGITPAISPIRWVFGAPMSAILGILLG